MLARKDRMVSWMVVLSSQFPSFPQLNRSAIKSVFIHETIIMVCKVAITCFFALKMVSH